ncbi:NUDIX hydrolase [Sediminibacterium sp.]|uniref:NUDIX hydrolase n=1 Tax=Sediminibacterium sp. TaxID=1917865 RepID=UPI002733A1C1|nr:NUDIX domain-containing protein [Sediminibacterium sp.]MDP3393851.1 NUDIX domain-containing protein [Sediminibacterium sp.]MDP3568819.1 NUDIX domain-containing protein [Sediminibacterium sp.]
MDNYGDLHINYFMQLKIIQAGGGLVLNEQNELLLIFRRGSWDLPKGKVDPNETIEACAMREVEEETGVGHLTLIDFLGITNHQYFDPYLKEEVIKESHWYTMSVKGVPALIPQTEEDITDIKWVPLSDVNALIADSFASIKEIIGLFFLKQPQ